jgi:type I restriction enzyme S subunit
MTSFIELCLSDGRFETYLQQGAMTGSDLPHVTGDGVARFPIPLPPLVEQAEIASCVDQWLERAYRVTKGIESASTMVEASLASALNRTFRGESAG